MNGIALPAEQKSASDEGLFESRTSATFSNSHDHLKTRPPVASDYELAQAPQKFESLMSDEE